MLFPESSILMQLEKTNSKPHISLKLFWLKIYGSGEFLESGRGSIYRKLSLISQSLISPPMEL